jgi:hypothetical protein
MRPGSALHAAIRRAARLRCGLPASWPPASCMLPSSAAPAAVIDFSCMVTITIIRVSILDEIMGYGTFGIPS